MRAEQVTVRQTCSYYVSPGPEVGASGTLLWVGARFSSDAADSTVRRISVENLVFSIVLIGIFP